MAVTRYTAICRRSGDWWAISVPELKGVHSQAKRLEQVDAMAREAIALMLDVAPDSFQVEVRPEVPAEVEAALAARLEAERAEERANRATIDAITSLLSRGMTVRDAGNLLHLSPQRVSQIARPRDRRSGRAQRAETTTAVQ